MKTCHDFRRILCIGCGQTIDVPIFCGDRFCEVCSLTRLIRVKHRLSFLLEGADVPPEHRFKHITLTITSETDLPAMIKHLLKAFQRLRNRQVWKSKVDGGAYVIEITGAPGRWHAHLHIVVVSKWIAWDKLMQAWRKCSGSRGVFITDIPKDQALSYLTKYLTKPDMPDQVSAEVSQSMKGIRLFAPIGSWFSLNKTYVKPKTPCKHCGGSRWLDWNFEVHHSYRPIVKMLQNGEWIEISSA